MRIIDTEITGAADCIKIGEQWLGGKLPCFIVAELSGNHDQEYSRAAELVLAAAEAGADAIKMQAYTADTITLDHDGPDFQIKKTSSWAEYPTLHSLYARAQTPWEWFEPLTALANDHGMEAFCSVFDQTSIDYLENINTPAYKIAAAEITDVPLLRAVAETGKPVILSSGLADAEDLQLAVDTLWQGGCTDIVLLKCTTEYPAPIEQANINTIPDMARRYSCMVGLSDHTLEPEVALAAVCLGAKVVEKHLTLDALETVDSFFSLKPDAFKAMVMQIRTIEKALGCVDYTIAGEHSGNRMARRSLYVSQSIKAGELFSAENIRSVRPSHGLHPRYWDALIGSVAMRDMNRGDRLKLDDLPAKKIA